MTLTEFLLARIAEDEAVARAGIDSQADPENGWGYGGYGSPRALTPHVGIIHERVQAEHIIRWHPARVLAECEAKRQIVRLHESWPVLVEQPPTFDRVDTSDPNTFAMRASQQIAWTTQQEYRRIFGSEPPTAPILRALAAVYADHPDCREEWKP